MHFTEGRPEVRTFFPLARLARFLNIALLAACHTFYSVPTHAQQADSLDWFPRKTGDMWEYWVYDGITLDTAQIINVRDSVSLDGRIHLTQRHRFINPTMSEYFALYTIDTAAGEVFGPSGELWDVLIYRFDVQRGDQWVMAERGGAYEMARAGDVYEDMVFGRNTTFVQMQYYGAADSADTNGLARYGDKLAKGLGLVERFHSEPGGHWYTLKGAVINGILFGDTTGTVTSYSEHTEDGLSAVLTLHQNYPNPFNGQTTIEFELSHRERIRLEVFNGLGQGVAVLFEGLAGPGRYRALFKTAGLASGIYFCRLYSPQRTVTRPMLFMK